MSSQSREIAIYHYCNEIHQHISRLNYKNITNFISYNEFNVNDNDVQEFINSNSYKIIAIGAAGASIENVSNLLSNLYEKVHHVFLYAEELFEDFSQLVRRYDYKNVTFILPGILNYELHNAELKVSPWWLTNTAELYLKNTHLLTDYNERVTKPYYFDLLLGIPKSHRTFIDRWLDPSLPVLKSPFLKSNSMHSNVLTTSPMNVWEDDIADFGDPNYIKFRDVECRVSQVIPAKIYRQTAFSLVCETHTDNICSFFTEKIAKPIIAKRMFIVVTGYHFLKNLRSLGFKTFNGIIDESYDEEPDHRKRYEMIIKEVERICTLDQQEIYRLIQPIVDYNFNTLYNLNPVKPGALVNSVLEHIIEIN